MKNPLPLLDVYSPIAEVLHAALEAQFKDKVKKERVVQLLVDWLVNRAKKKPVPDLEQKLIRWEKRIRQMVENMRFDFSEGKPVIKVSGSDEQTLKAFKFGSTWFEPNAELEETILTGLLDE